MCTINPSFKGSETLIPEWLILTEITSVFACVARSTKYLIPRSSSHTARQSGTYPEKQTSLNFSVYWHLPKFEAAAGSDHWS